MLLWDWQCTSDVVEVTGNQLFQVLMFEGVLNVSCVSLTDPAVHTGHVMAQVKGKNDPKSLKTTRQSTKQRVESLNQPTLENTGACRASGDGIVSLDGRNEQVAQSTSQRQKRKWREGPGRE